MKAILCFPYTYPSQGNLSALALALKLWNNVELTCLRFGSTEDSLSLSMPLPIPVVRLVHPSLDGMDDLTLGYVIAEVVRAQEAGIIIFGDRVDAEGIGLLPAVVAHQLQYPLYSQVTSVQMEKAVHHRIDLGIEAGGKSLEIAIKPPAVLVAARMVKPLPIITTSATIATLDWASIKLDPMKLVARPNLLGDLDTATCDREPPRLADFKKILAR